MQPKSGYKAVTPIILLNAVAAYNAGLISFRALRVYAAVLHLLAIRDAAGRRRAKAGMRPLAGVLYRLTEFEPLVGSKGSLIRRDLSALRRAGLIRGGSRDLAVADEPLPFAGPLIERASGGRRATRPIPVPRSLLRFLSREATPSLFLTVVAHLLRGLSFRGGGGEIVPRGTVKASWIAEHFGLSLRAVKAARARLIGLGFITRDTASLQRKLNRDGAYFVINLDFGAGAACTGSAPLPLPGRTGSAPPYKDLKTTSVSKNQEAGVRPEASIRDVRPEDLRTLSRAEELYRQAVARGLVADTEADRLNFFSAMIRARKFREAPRIFMGIVRRRLWHHITLAEEDEARAALARLRARAEAADQAACRPAPPCPAGGPPPRGRGAREGLVPVGRAIPRWDRAAA
ncbi:hypothetical protein [Tautonia sociabilis]|uniref:Uncharacterized protein n=1 Tax=Tautonia sociabilis TaxID=2080755 RepID=A0A432MKP2_9BACT|nr:hypothetical protein [Tautonia sociabilis]RUL87994.1 hypothetical protein TsocGM_09745 [Tautonia sociabilis]